jgi:hypothetical protein
MLLAGGRIRGALFFRHVLFAHLSVRIRPKAVASLFAGAAAPAMSIAS